MNGGQHTASELVRLEISEVEAHVDELKEAIRQEVSRGKLSILIALLLSTTNKY